MPRLDPYAHLTDPHAHGLDAPELTELARQAVQLAERHTDAGDKLTAARTHRQQLPDQLADLGATAALAGKAGPNVRTTIAEADAELAAAEVEADGIGRALSQARQGVEDHLREHGQRYADEHAAQLAELRDHASAALITAREQLDGYPAELAFHQALQAAQARRVMGHHRPPHLALGDDRARFTDTRATVGPAVQQLGQAAAALAELPPHPEPEQDDDRPLELIADG